MAAQDVAQLRTNVRVRVVTFGASSRRDTVVRVATLQRVERDAIVVTTRRAVHRLAIDSTIRIDVSRRTRRHPIAGAFIGLILVAGLVQLAPCKGSDSGIVTCEDMRPGLSVLGGAVGAIFGGLMGYSIVKDDWQEVPRPWSISVR